MIVRVSAEPLIGASRTLAGFPAMRATGNSMNPLLYPLDILDRQGIDRSMQSPRRFQYGARSRPGTGNGAFT